VTANDVTAKDVTVNDGTASGMLALTAAAATEPARIERSDRPGMLASLLKLRFYTFVFLIL
jgi:hypothetical protein